MSRSAASVGPPPEVEADEAERDSLARRVLEDIATTGEPAELAFPDAMRVLAGYRSSCERKGQYREAFLVQHVLQQLRREEGGRHARALATHQEQERLDLEEAHFLEFQQFTEAWDAKIDEVEERLLENEAAMLDRHGNELAAFHMEMAHTAPRGRPKFSRDLLAARKAEETLVRAKDYAAAHRVKAQADAQEARELLRLEEERAVRFAKREAHLLARHRAELQVMRSRMESARLELERTRRKELSMLLQRYQNVRRGLVGQQNIRRARTGTLLMKHAANKRADPLGPDVLTRGLVSGTSGASSLRRIAHSPSSADAVPKELPPIR